MPLPWAEVRPIGNTNSTWDCGCVSGDGSKVVVGNYTHLDWATEGRLFITLDIGVTWGELRPAGNDSKNWTWIVSDYDGSHFMATYFYGPVYVSTDGGVTWADRTPIVPADKLGFVGNYIWEGLAINKDGSRLVVSVSYPDGDGDFYTSSDGGLNWVRRFPAGALTRISYRASASDATGGKLIIASLSSGGATGRAWLSTDFGVTWVETQPNGNIGYNWTHVASDSTGTRLSASSFKDLFVLGGRFFTSGDGGVTWLERQPDGAVDRAWFGAAVSDGNVVVTAINNTVTGRIWSSPDFGATWELEQPVVTLIEPWRGVYMSRDGLTVLAFSYTVLGSIGRVFLAAVAPLPPPPPPPPPVVSRDFFRRGKPYIKCGNVWDWCLKNSECPWYLVPWGEHGCIPVKCWRLEDDPLHSIPEQGRELHKYGSIPLPALPSVDTQILSFRVPLGYDGIIYSVLCKFMGTGYVNGDGNLIWRFRQNQYWIKSLHSIPTELGDFSAYMQLDEYIRIYSGQTIRAYGWLNMGSGLVGGSMIAALQGWYFPSQFAR